MSTCNICIRINHIEKQQNPYFVAELETGYVVLGDHQYYQGYTLFLSKTHVHELHELPGSNKVQFLKDMSIVAEAVYRSFHPAKLNYELLGNRDAHLHWHIFPRYEHDKEKHMPIWAIPAEIRNAPATIPDASQLAALKTTLRAQLELLTI